MRQNLVIVLLLATMSACAQNKSSSMNWDIKKIATVDWNTQTGIPYSKVPGANLGATSFQLLDSARIAFLSNASNEIIVADKESGKSITRFTLPFTPRDFVFENGIFYVLGERLVSTFIESGEIKEASVFPDKYVGVERIARYNNATYLLLPSGNSFELTANKEHEGWITNVGSFFACKLNGDTYTISATTVQGKMFEKTFAAQRKVAGAFVIGATESRLIIDVQTYISENPVAIERSVVAVELTSAGIGNISAAQRLPDCYYVLSNKDLDVGADGIALNMVTSPQGVHVFSLKETEVGAASDYPASLLKIKYHFNNNLLSVD